MGQEIVSLERNWGTTDDECRAFVADLYRWLYGWAAGNGGPALSLPVGRDAQEVVVDAEDAEAARSVVQSAAGRADPSWRRLYRLIT